MKSTDQSKRMSQIAGEHSSFAGNRSSSLQFNFRRRREFLRLLLFNKEYKFMAKSLITETFYYSFINSYCFLRIVESNNYN